MTTSVTTSLVILLALAQCIALAVLLARLLPGRRRPAPAAPAERAKVPTTVTIIVATLNEAARIGPCIEGLKLQGDDLIEVLFVDSDSKDGTRELIEAACREDARFQLMSDAPRPEDWVGKVWALETGLRRARGEWILGIDADTLPRRGMVGGVVNALMEHGYDAASFGPCFVGQTDAERWLQPAMLTTLIYRTGAAASKNADPRRVLANGQCFMARRATLLANNGYAVARQSFSDDVTLARHLAANGARVGFLDGRNIISVHAYRSAREMWREWGRSFDLKDSATVLRGWGDVVFVWLAMALPVPVLVWALSEVIASPSLMASMRNVMQSAMHSGLHINASPLTLGISALVAANAFLLSVRILLLVAIRGSYSKRGWSFWLSWLADIPAAVRLTMSTATRPRSWRGRSYQ